MRVCIHLVGFAMGRPAGVSDADADLAMNNPEAFKAIVEKVK